MLWTDFAVHRSDAITSARPPFRQASLVHGRNRASLTMFAVTERHSMDGSPARTQAGRQSRSAFLYRLAPLTTKSASPNRPLITPAHYRPADDPSGQSQWPTPYPETNTCAC